MEKKIFDDITKKVYEFKYKSYHDDRNHLIDDDQLLYDKNFFPKIFDNNIFNCNLDNIAKRTNVLKLKELNDHSIVTLDDVYCNPLAVRNFISEIPHSLNRQVQDSMYPGYVSFLGIRLHDLNIVTTKLILLYFKYLNIDTKNLNIDIEFNSALYNSKNILYENANQLIHRDSGTKYSLAGIIYMNMEEEYDGGTSFYSEKNELVHLNKMKFNSLVLYPSKVYHCMYLDDIKKSFRNNYRITQRIFIELPDSE